MWWSGQCLPLSREVGFDTKMSSCKLKGQWALKEILLHFKSSVTSKIDGELRRPVGGKAPSSSLTPLFSFLTMISHDELQQVSPDTRPFVKANCPGSGAAPSIGRWAPGTKTWRQTVEVEQQKDKWAAAQMTQLRITWDNCCQPPDDALHDMFTKFKGPFFFFLSPHYCHSTRCKVIFRFSPLSLLSFQHRLNTFSSCVSALTQAVTWTLTIMCISVFVETYPPPNPLFLALPQQNSGWEKKLWQLKPRDWEPRWRCEFQPHCTFIRTDDWLLSSIPGLLFSKIIEKNNALTMRRDRLMLWKILYTTNSDSSFMLSCVFWQRRVEIPVIAVLFFLPCLYLGFFFFTENKFKGWQNSE